MARNRVIIETITCDLCGNQVREPSTKRLALDKDSWNLDLCENDAAVVERQISEWTKNATKTQSNSSRRSAGQGKDDWTYLESMGFTKHRGRKTPAENAALAAR